MNILSVIAQVAAASAGVAATQTPFLASPQRQVATPANPKAPSRREETSMTPSNFKLNRVSLLMLGVTDLPVAVTFYRDTLGLQPQGGVGCPESSRSSTQEA